MSFLTSTILSISVIIKLRLLPYFLMHLHATCVLNSRLLTYRFHSSFKFTDLWVTFLCKVKIAIIGILAAGFGLDFSTAQHVVFLELPQSPTLMLQVLFGIPLHWLICIYNYCWVVELVSYTSDLCFLFVTLIWFVSNLCSYDDTSDLFILRKWNQFNK